MHRAYTRTLFAGIDRTANFAISGIALLAAANVVVKTSSLADGMCMAIIHIVIRAGIDLRAHLAIAREAFVARACVFSTLPGLQSSLLSRRVERLVVNHQIHILALRIDSACLPLDGQLAVVNRHALLAIALEVLVACALVGARPRPLALGVETAAAKGGQLTWVNRCARLASASKSRLADAVVGRGACAHTISFFSTATEVFLARVDGNAHLDSVVELKPVHALTQVAVRAYTNAVLVANAATVEIFAAVDLGTVLATAKETLVTLACAHSWASLCAFSVTRTVAIVLVAFVDLGALFARALVALVACAIVLAGASGLAGSAVAAAV